MRKTPLSSFLFLPVLTLWMPKTLGTDDFQINQRPTVVAVIDTGADIHHEELQSHLWTNPKETLNGLDDDGNGFVDDIVGWNFSAKTSDISDHDGHGTHIAGLIKKSFSEKKGTENLRLMILKYTHKDGRNSKSSFLQALQYAIDQKADLINISASGRGFSKQEFDLFKKAFEQGIQVVVATGNKHPGAPNTVTYPASYNLENIHPVAAVDKQGKLLPISNSISRQHVFHALGEEVFSILPGQEFGIKTGTSQATALVSGRMAAFLNERKSHRILAQSFVSFP